MQYPEIARIFPGRQLPLETMRVREAAVSMDKESAVPLVVGAARPQPAPVTRRPIYVRQKPFMNGAPVRRSRPRNASA